MNPGVDDRVFPQPLASALVGLADMDRVVITPRIRTDRLFLLASSSTDGTVLLWNVTAGIPQPRDQLGPDGYWEVWRNEPAVIVNFSSPHPPVQNHTPQNPQPQFVLPTSFQPRAQCHISRQACRFTRTRCQCRMANRQPST